MHVLELWRYPVKSMRGELLQTARLTSDGVEGDRLIHVRGTHGVLTARTRHGLLGFDATTAPDGAVLINGRPWDDPIVAREVRDVAGADAEVVRYGGSERFDVLPLLVATDGGVQAFGHDRRRLRPNIVIGGVSGLAERSWAGSALRIGDALVGVLKLRARCIVTTIDPDTGEQNLDVLRRIRHKFDGAVALDCWVESEGVINVGDPVELVQTQLSAPEPGGWVVGAPYAVV